MPPTEPRPHTTWRHTSTGKLYHVFGVATCSTNGERDGVERSVVYRPIDGPGLFYRDVAEFVDGRFVPLSAPGDPGAGREE